MLAHRTSDRIPHRQRGHTEGGRQRPGLPRQLRDAHRVGAELPAEAVDVFCYQARKWIAACTAAIGGLDTLVFSAGIGQNSPVIRSRICTGLEFLGVTLDEARNGANAAVISTTGAPVVVRVIKTDEELMIARDVLKLLANGGHG